MKLLINISEKLYKDVVEYSNAGYLGSDVWVAVASGVPYEEKPHGEWLDYSEQYEYVECPFCNQATNCNDNIDELHYCWNCGAYLQKGGAKNAN